MAALIYARQSDQANRKKVVETDTDSLSCRAQVEECQRLAATNGDTVVKVFSEQFTSFTADRPEWQSLLATVKENHARYAKGNPDRITRLYVHNYKRLGRDDVGYTIAANLKSLGIEVIPVADKPFGDDMAGKIMQFLSYQFAGAQVTDALEQANATRRSITAAGKLICCGKAAYGYRYDMTTRQRVVKPDESEVVVRIFKAIADGISVYQICNDLLADGVLPPRQKLREDKLPGAAKLLRWNERNIVRMIENPSYKGETMAGYKFLRQEEGRYSNGRKKVKVVEGKPVGDPSPRIVEDDLWETANKNLAKSKRKPRSHAYWLKGRVRCGNCGRTLVRTWNKNAKRHQWMCSGYTHKKGCNNMYTHNKDIETPAWDRLLLWAKDAGVVESKLKELEEKMVDPSRAKLVRDNERDIANFKRQLADLTDSWTDAPNKAVRQAIADKMTQLGQTIEAHENMREQFAEDAARVEEAQRHCRDLREVIRSRIDAGTATEEEKAKLAEAIGLTVIVERLAEGRAIQFLAFDYEGKKMWVDRTGARPPIVDTGKKAEFPFIVPQTDGSPDGQTKDRLFARMTVAL